MTRRTCRGAHDPLAARGDLSVSGNGEFITLHNRCSTARPLTNWMIRDAGPNHTYLFGTYTLGAGKDVRVHSGKGTNTATDRYWGLGQYVWNNDKDTAYVRDSPNRTLIDTCGYNNPRASWIYC